MSGGGTSEFGIRARVEIGSIPVDVVSTRDVLAEIRRSVEDGQTTHIVTTNAEYVVMAQTNSSFSAVLRQADLSTPDSTLVVWALRRKGAVQRERVGGSDLIWSISELAASSGYRIFLLGSGAGIAQRASSRLAARYPELAIAGAWAGSPHADEEASIVHLIRQSRAHILFVAFGAPEQDLWIARNLAETGAAVAVGVGGSFDYVAGVARRAPRWMQRKGLEWLWRLVLQPWRWRRMLALPKFVALVLRETRR